MRVLSFVALCAALTGCGDNSMMMGTPDMAASPDLAGADLAGGDLTMVVSGMQVATGDLTLFGVTSDDYILYYDANATDVTLLAVSFAGGQPMTVATKVDLAGSGVEGKVVFAWHDTDPNGVGPLAVWTASSAAHDVAQRSAGGFGAASTDGATVALIGNVDGNDAMGDLMTVKVDGTSPQTLVAGVDIGAVGCAANIDYVGARVVAATCPAGVTMATVSTFDATGKKTDLQAMAQPLWWADPSGTTILTVDGTNVGRAFPIAGGAATVDSLTDFSDGRMLDGGAVIYTTSAGALTRGGAGAGSLVASGVIDLYGVSPDGKWVMYYTQSDNSGLFTDLQLISSATGGQPLALLTSATGTSGGVFGNSFTADSSNALFFGSVDSTNFVGTLYAQPVAGGAQTTLATSSAVVHQAGGNRIAFDQNFAPDPNGSGVGDILSKSLAGSTAAALLATSSKLDFNVSASGQQMVYSYKADMTRAGLYVITLP